MLMYVSVARSEAEYRRARVAADFDRQRARRRMPRQAKVGSHRFGRTRHGQPPVAERGWERMRVS
jgi:hypothetical protein